MQVIICGYYNMYYTCMQADIGHIASRRDGGGVVVPHAQPAYVVRQDEQKVGLPCGASRNERRSSQPDAELGSRPHQARTTYQRRRCQQ